MKYFEKMADERESAFFISHFHKVTLKHHKFSIKKKTQKQYLVDLLSFSPLSPKRWIVLQMWPVSFLFASKVVE